MASIEIEAIGTRQITGVDNESSDLGHRRPLDSGIPLPKPCLTGISRAEMADLLQIISQLSALEPAEAAELSKLLEQKWGVSAALAGATDAMGVGPRNWMNLTEAQVNFGLVQRDIVTISFATKARNQRAPGGMAEAIGSLSDVLRPSFLEWWRTGIVRDVSEPGGMSLRRLLDGAYPVRRSAIGAFMDMDYVLKDPTTRVEIATATPMSASEFVPGSR